MGFTTLNIVLAHNHSDVIEYLLKDTKANMNSTHKTHVTTIIYAVSRGHFEAMRILLDVGGMDVNEFGVNSGSVLLDLVTGGATKAITFMLE